MILKLINLAYQQVGVTEYPPSSNNVIYNTEYYGHPVSGSSYPWCAVFIWWLFKHSDLSQLFLNGNKTASCTAIKNFYENQNQWYTDKNYKPGDIAILTFSKTKSIQHCGLIVENLGSGKYKLIEGNTSNNASGSQDNGGCVAIKTRQIDNIIGVCRPSYSIIEDLEDDNMTDDQFAEFMDRYLSNLAKKESPKWSDQELKEAIDLGITDGNRPMQLIPRYQAAIMALRACKLKKGIFK